MVLWGCVVVWLWFIFGRYIELLISSMFDEQGSVISVIYNQILTPIPIPATHLRDQG